MHPLALSDHQLRAVLDGAVVVPIELRDEYLKRIAKWLPVHGNINQIVGDVLAKMHVAELKAAKKLRKAEKQRQEPPEERERRLTRERKRRWDARQRENRKDPPAFASVEYDGSVLALLVVDGCMDDDETDRKKIGEALSKYLRKQVEKYRNALHCQVCGCRILE